MKLFRDNKLKETASNKIRVEVVRSSLPVPQKSLAAKSLSVKGSTSRSSSAKPSQRSSTPRPKSKSPYPSSSDEKQLDRKRKATSPSPLRQTPAPVQSNFDKDSDAEDDDGWLKLDAEVRKRQRKGNLDSTRNIRNLRAFEAGLEDLDFVHAVNVASLHLKNVVPAMNAPENEVAIVLQHPSCCPRERYELIKGKDKIPAVECIINIIQLVAETYLTEEEAEIFNCPTKGFIRRLVRASAIRVQDYVGFKATVKEYNDLLASLVEDGTIARNLDRLHQLPSHLVKFILAQTYDRAVAPSVESLNRYKVGTDGVYGELLYPFISKILVDDTKMTSHQVFVDMGSGVGNVVLQAALEIGCESWGCEMVENSCNLAEAQQKEFEARCMIWGIQPGEVHLERGDFRKSTRTLEALKRADVVLVNNKAFTPSLNAEIVNLFFDLKKGCKVISLRSFVSKSTNSVNDPGSSIFDVETHTYPQSYVSWADSGGEYYISTKK